MKSSIVMCIIAVGGCALASPAAAQVYKCVDPKTGAKTYSDSGCARSAQRTTMEALPPVVTRAPQAARPAPVQDWRADEARAGLQPAVAEPVGSIAPPQGDPNSYECEQAKRKLAVRRSRVTNFASDAKEPIIDVNRICGYFMNPNPMPGQLTRQGTR
ncbi:DUF4124 domain-containing protein [Oxalobacteraceae sp. CFBP 13708]|nr:DUF4124 domain-containing protein [Oxalobacteraceae sp. CFBP 8753]MBD8722444.1 DUF4124 domain-containing protein [Oxalobacteraceae sp. CFBP 13708]